MIGPVLGVLIILAIVALWVVRGRRAERRRAERDGRADADLGEPPPPPPSPDRASR